MRLLQNIIKLYSSSIFKRTPWIASSCFSTPLQNHPRKDTHNTSTLSVFASHQAKQSRSYTWNTLKPTLFVFVFLLIGFSSFTTFTYAVPDDGNSNVGCPSGTVRTSKTKECVPNFIPLVGIPYIDNPNNISSMADYVSALYKISISIAAFLAVIKIIFAGVKYMLSDVVTDKGAAKKDIRGALIGLLIVIGAVLILNTINPQLRNLNVLKGPGVDVGLKTYDNICSTKPNSAECCRKEGGKYILTSGGNICNLGDIIDSPDKYRTGDSEGDIAQCLTDGRVWDSIAKGCRALAKKEVFLPESSFADIPVPNPADANYENDLIYYYRELTALCQSFVATSEYKPETNTCRAL